MPTENEALLDAEQAVTELLENLTQLKTTIGGYGKATATLQDTRSDLSNVIEQLGRLAGDTELLIKNLGKLQTPEIVNKLEEMRSVNNQSLEQLNKCIATVQASQKQFEQTVSTVTKDSAATFEGIGKVADSKLASHIAKADTLIAGLTGTLEQMRQQSLSQAQEIQNKFKSGLVSSHTALTKNVEAHAAKTMELLASSKAEMERRMKGLMIALLVGLPLSIAIIIAVFIFTKH